MNENQHLDAEGYYRPSVVFIEEEWERPDTQHMTDGFFKLGRNNPGRWLHGVEISGDAGKILDELWRNRQLRTALNLWRAKKINGYAGIRSKEDLDKMMKQIMLEMKNERN